jgi:Transmembrane protein family 72
MKFVCFIVPHSTEIFNCCILHGIINLHFPPEKKRSKLKLLIYSLFTLTRLVRRSKERKSLCVQCWKWTGFLGSWRLSFPYVAIGVALIMWPHNLWLSYIGGVQLIILAMLRMLTVFRANVRGREDSLLPEFDDNTDK